MYDESLWPQLARLPCKNGNDCFVLARFSTDEDESKGIIVHKTSSKNFSTYEDKSKRSIFNENLSYNRSADEAKLNSTEEYKS